MPEPKRAIRIGDVLKQDVHGRNEDSQTVLLLAAGQLIETETQLRQLVTAGFAVEFPRQTAPKPEPQNGKRASAQAATRLQEEFDDQVAAARKVREQVKRSTGELLRRFRAGDNPKTGELLAFSAKIVSEVTAAPYALAAIAHLTPCDEYLVDHSVNVSILMAGMAHVQGQAGYDLTVVALAGLMHDVGRQFVRPGILGRSGTLSADEFGEVKKHPGYGHEVLENTADCPAEVALVALQHHERADGSGYAQGLKADAIHPYSRLAAVADVFDARTFNRPHNSRVTAWEALSDFHLHHRSEFEEAAVHALTKLVGVFPLGTSVRLDSGEIGTVVAPNPDDGNLPVLTIHKDRHSIPLAYPYNLDLQGSPRRIVGAWG